jgi:hypothetical protein
MSVVSRQSDCASPPRECANESNISMRLAAVDSLLSISPQPLSFSFAFLDNFFRFGRHVAHFTVVY